MLQQHEQVQLSPMLGGGLEYNENRWWINVDDLKYVLMGLCHLIHLDLTTVRTNSDLKSQYIRPYCKTGTNDW